ncbi:MAG: hypothetical protein M5U26_20965 [Planctomycetota bacterium]|nr:hypothetical protein [Planctomycetota bacterium]
MRNSSRHKLLYGCAGLLGLLTLGASATDYYPPPPEPPPPPPGVAEAYYSTCAGTHPTVKYVLPSVIPGDPQYNEYLVYRNSAEYRRYEHDLLEYKKKYGGQEAGTFGEVDGQSGRVVRAGRKPLNPEGPIPEKPPEPPKDETSDAPEPAPPPTPPPPEAVAEQPAQNPAATPATETPPPETAADGIRSGPDSFMGYNVAALEGGVGGSGLQAIRLSRDPKQDLSRWFRGFLYHDEVQQVTYEDAPEPNSALGDATAGPAASNSFYGRLVNMLELDERSAPPAPNEMLKSLDGLWKDRWSKTLGFSSDLGGRRLAGDLQRVQDEVRAAQRELDRLSKERPEEKAAQVKVQDQTEFQKTRLAAAELKLKGLRAQLKDRLAFVEAVSALLRLAPEGGFGPTFFENDLESVQQSAERVLADIGPLAAREVWAGLADDLNWLAGHPADAACVLTQQERTRRLLAVSAGEKLIKDPRMGGLDAVCDFLKEVQDPPPAVLRKSFELVDILGSKQLEPVVLAVLPSLLRHLESKNEQVSSRARWVLLRILDIRAGKASMEETIGVLAPVLKDKDQELAGAAEAFLTYHTGQKHGRNANAWLGLKKRMEAERKKAEAKR